MVVYYAGDANNTSARASSTLITWMPPLANRLE